MGSTIHKGALAFMILVIKLHSFGAESITTSSPYAKALGMLESGNDDNARGNRGEISRYQIMPYIWKKYSRGISKSKATDHQYASLVVCRYMEDNWTRMKNKTGKVPSDLDVYILWNLGYHKYNQYFKLDFDKLPYALKERAFRFTNLVTMYNSTN